MNAERLLPLRLDRVAYAPRGVPLLEDVSLEIDASGRTVLLGPNGAGKSLLLKICHGLISPTAGRIDWSARPERVRAGQAMVFQRPVLLRRSAAANVAYALAVRGVPRSRRRELVAEALRIAGLEAIARRPARVLSGGEQQRLALARAWAVRPEVLLLDEPTANLDPSATRAVEEVLGTFRAAGTKLVMTTHDLGQARRMADDVVFLHRGRVVERGPADRFFDRAGTMEARAFVAGDLLW